MSEPIARVELTMYAEAEDVQYIIERLNAHNPYTLEYVNDPEDGEPDFYFVVEEDDS